MRDLLTRLYGFPSSDVRMMLDAPGDEMPTRHNIMQGIAWLVAEVQPGDCLFFHYSGHGGQQEDPTGTEDDCMDETLLPVDFQEAGQIVDDELFDVLCGALPSGVKLTCVMDCCHSGTGLDLPFDYNLQERDWNEDDNPCHSEGDVQLFSGCRDDQTSADVQNCYQQARGAMTSAFCDTLGENTTPTYPQLLDALHAHLERNGHSQRPQLTSSQNFDLNATTFQVAGGIHPNQNELIGRQFRKKKEPKNEEWIDDNDPLKNMLSNADSVIGLASTLIPLATASGFFGGTGAAAPAAAPALPAAETVAAPAAPVAAPDSSGGSFWGWFGDSGDDGLPQADDFDDD